MTAFLFENSTGQWVIAPHNGRFHVFWEEEDLGSYHSPESALDDLTGGHTFWPSSGIDPSHCRIPDELSEWSVVPVR